MGDESTLSPEMKEHYEKFEKMIKEHTDKFNKKMKEHSEHFKAKFAELLEQQKNAQFRASKRLRLVYLYNYRRAAGRRDSASGPATHFPLRQLPSACSTLDVLHTLKH